MSTVLISLWMPARMSVSMRSPRMQASARDIPNLLSAARIIRGLGLPMK